MAFWRRVDTISLPRIILDIGEEVPDFSLLRISNINVTPIALVRMLEFNENVYE